MKAVFASFFSVLILVQTAFTGDWSQWRGDNRDGVTHGEKALANLPAKPRTLWQVPAGKGQGGLSVIFVIPEFTDVFLSCVFTRSIIRIGTPSVLFIIPPFTDITVSI